MFSHWYNEIADMPAKVNGVWVDLETGIPFSPSNFKAPSKPLSEKAKDARSVAKNFGGKALTGTAKQKEWAEKIRAAVLSSVTTEQAEILCFCTKFKTAKFWIEARHLTAAQLAEKAEKYATLVKKANAINKKSQLIPLSDVARCKAAIAERDIVIEELEAIF